MDQQDFANFTVQLNESFSLPPILRAITSAAEYNNHRMLACSSDKLRRFAVWSLSS
jgi:hypothetical protein